MQKFERPTQLNAPAKPKFRFGAVNVPSMEEPATEGPESVRWERVHRHKKKLEQENKTRTKKRRLVCYTCWGKDGSCCCNLHEVDADHPLMVTGSGHQWKCAGGDGRCVEIPNAVRITNDGRKGP